MAAKREPYKGVVRVFRVFSDFEGKGKQLEPDFDFDFDSRPMRGKERAERKVVGGEVKIGIVLLESKKKES